MAILTSRKTKPGSPALNLRRRMSSCEWRLKSTQLILQAKRRHSMPHQSSKLRLKHAAEESLLRSTPIWGSMTQCVRPDSMAAQADWYRANCCHIRGERTRWSSPT